MHYVNFVFRHFGPHGLRIHLADYKRWVQDCLRICVAKFGCKLAGFTRKRIGHFLFLKVLKSHLV